MLARSHAAMLSLLALACQDAAPEDTAPASTPGRLTMHLEVGWPEVGYGPLPGATVSFDDALGRRTEVVSDASGTVSLDLDDWQCQGPVTLTVDPAEPGQGLVTIMELGPAWDGSVIRFNDNAALAHRVTISGLAEPRAEGTWLRVIASGAVGTWYQGDTPGYAVDVLPDTPFELLAAELSWKYTGHEFGISQTLSGWTRVAAGPVRSDSQLHIDLSSALVPTPFSGRFHLPAMSRTRCTAPWCGEARPCTPRWGASERALAAGRPGSSSTWTDSPSTTRANTCCRTTATPPIPMSMHRAR